MSNDVAINVLCGDVSKKTATWTLLLRVEMIAQKCIGKCNGQFVLKPSTSTLKMPSNFGKMKRISNPTQCKKEEKPSHGAFLG